MSTLRRIALTLIAAFLAAIPAHAAQKTTAPHRVGRVLHDNVAVVSRPSAHAATIAVLVEETPVEVLGSHGDWTHIRIWGSVDGWIARKDITFRKPWFVVSTYHAPQVHYHVHASSLRSLNAGAVLLSSADLAPAPGANPARVLPAGTRVTIRGWRQDASGQVWYRVGDLWARSDAIRLDRPHASTRARSPLWAPVTGKGMWLTLGIVADSSPDAIVQAALRDHITHLYVESAISPLGFHGKDTVGHLLDDAVKHHVAVIAWVYPYLVDIASDVDLTVQVARFSTPSGTRFTGIASDLERNMTPAAVGTYSQLVRQTLGGNTLLVGVTYPPQSLPSYPFAEVGRSFDVVAPMDYWHQTRTAYGLDYGHMRYGQAYTYRYARDSIDAVRRAAGRVPVAPIGQTFDNFGRAEMGPYAPSASEIRGFLDGAKADGAVGASFFEWTSATPPQWNTIRSFTF